MNTTNAIQFSTHRLNLPVPLPLCYSISLHYPRWRPRCRRWLGSRQQTPLPCAPQACRGAVATTLRCLVPFFCFRFPRFRLFCFNAFRRVLLHEFFVSPCMTLFFLFFFLFFSRGLHMLHMYRFIAPNFFHVSFSVCGATTLGGEIHAGVRVANVVCDGGPPLHRRRPEAPVLHGLARPLEGGCARGKGATRKARGLFGTRRK